MWKAHSKLHDLLRLRGVFPDLPVELNRHISTFVRDPDTADAVLRTNRVGQSSYDRERFEQMKASWRALTQAPFLIPSDEIRTRTYYEVPNDVTQEQFHSFVHAVASGALANLEQIYLEDNQIGDVGMSSLSEALAKGSMADLEVLGFDKNQIGDLENSLGQGTLMVKRRKTIDQVRDVMEVWVYKGSSPTDEGTACSIRWLM